MKTILRNLILISLCVACLPPTQVSAMNAEDAAKRTALLVGWSAAAAVASGGYYVYHRLYNTAHDIEALAGDAAAATGLTQEVSGAGAKVEGELHSLLGGHEHTTAPAAGAGHAAGDAHQGTGVIAHLEEAVHHSGDAGHQADHAAGTSHEAAAPTGLLGKIEAEIHHHHSNSSHHTDAHHAAASTQAAQPHDLTDEEHRTAHHLFTLFNKSKSVRNLVSAKAKQYNVPLKADKKAKGKQAKDDKKQ